MRITNELIEKYKSYLIEEEKANLTIEKYIRDVTAFHKWLYGRTVDKSVVLQYKQWLVENQAPASINSILSSLNSFFLLMSGITVKLNH